MLLKARKLKLNKWTQVIHKVDGTYTIGMECLKYYRKPSPSIETKHEYICSIQQTCRSSLLSVNIYNSSHCCCIWFISIIHLLRRVGQLLFRLELFCWCSRTRWRHFTNITRSILVVLLHKRNTIINTVNDHPQLMFQYYFKSMSTWKQQRNSACDNRAKSVTLKPSLISTLENQKLKTAQFVTVSIFIDNSIGCIHANGSSMAVMHTVLYNEARSRQYLKY
jgi:hypothetical protein